MSARAGLPSHRCDGADSRSRAPSPATEGLAPAPKNLDAAQDRDTPRRVCIVTRPRIHMRTAIFVALAGALALASCALTPSAQPVVCEELNKVTPEASTITSATS